MNSKRTLFAGCGAAALALALAGCQAEYLARQDLIEPYSGEAVAANRVLQTPDPWPRGVYDNNIYTSGRNQAAAYKKYETKHEEAERQEIAPVQLVVPPQ